MVLFQTNADTSASADMSPKVDVDVGLSNNKDGSDVEDHEKTASRLSATALLGQDVVPEHRVLFRVRFSLMESVTAVGSRYFSTWNSFGG